MIVGWNFASRGFALCNGQLLPISQNTALFSLLGTIYGGNGQSTFQLPNLQGRVAIHQGQSPGTSVYPIGEIAGTETTTLTVNNMPMHIHTAVNTAPTITTPITAVTTINGVARPSSRQSSPAGGVPTGGQDTVSGNGVDVFAPPSAGTTVALAAETATTVVSGPALAPGTTTIGAAGGSMPFNNLQPFVVVNYLIALVGIFPSRN